MDYSNQTIAFTLPISCHICLGKVKQPVLCSNQHVFCELCLKVWLERNPACPTCRVPITTENPYRSVLSGGSDANEFLGEQRWDLLRTRVEISLREYEEEQMQQKQRTQTLEKENKVLLDRLASEVREGSSTERTTDNSDFLILNEQLRDINFAYEKAKKDVSKLKQENRTLTDTNVNLLRETERLRLEVSRRSPQKFGRITVATLQSKVEDYEKRIKQLQKALENTDDYVTELEQKLTSCYCGGVQGAGGGGTSNERSRNELETEPVKRTCQRKIITTLADRADTESPTAERTFHMGVANRFPNKTCSTITNESLFDQSSLQCVKETDTRVSSKLIFSSRGLMSKSENPAPPARVQSFRNHGSEQITLPSAKSASCTDDAAGASTGVSVNFAAPRTSSVHTSPTKRIRLAKNENL